MPGASNVVGNMYLWVGATRMASHRAMKRHIKGSETYARTIHPWQNQTGGTQGDVFSNTIKAGSRIEAAVGYRSVPSKTGSKGWWLENPNRNVRVYGRGAPFGKRFANLERARDNNIGSLVNELRRIYARGGVPFTGVGVGLGRIR